jgi:P4 family phage/plasmid primase-like protien
MELLGPPLYVEMNCGIIVKRPVANLDAEKGKLLGARVAVFNELNPGEKLNTSEVHLLSGGDGIPAAPKYLDPMTIIPRHLCILTTNHLPELTEVKVATVERILVFPFPVTFVDLAEGEAPTLTRRQRDNGLKQKLSSNKQGFLAWLVKGAVMWYATKDLKKNAPAKVKEFSKKYFDEQDRLARFIRESCRVGEGEIVAAAELNVAFFEWSKGEGGEGVKGGVDAKTMEAKGFLKKKTRPHVRCVNPVACYLGLSLKTDDMVEVWNDQEEL